MEQLYKRENYLKRIREFYSDTELIKVITGVRRCGKSSIMQMIHEELLEQGVPGSNIFFIQLDVRPYKTIRTTEQLERAIDSKAEGVKGKKYLFLDEIQNIRGFEETINAYRAENFSIFITGSNRYLLSGELSTKLTGRYIEFEIQTLTFSEYLGMKRFFNKPLDEDMDVEFLNYIREGGFPLAIQYDSTEAKRTYVKSIIREIFERDIKTNSKIRKKELFSKLQTYIINNFGSPTSVNSLCKALADNPRNPVRKETIYNYLNLNFPKTGKSL